MSRVKKPLRPTMTDQIIVTMTPEEKHKLQVIAYSHTLNGRPMYMAEYVREAIAEKIARDGTIYPPVVTTSKALHLFRRISE